MLQLLKQSQRLVPAAAANLRIGLEIGAHLRAVRIVVNPAQIIIGQVYTPHTGWFTPWHSGDR